MIKGKKTQEMRSIQIMLRQSLFRIIICMVVPLIFLTALLIGLILRYDAMIADLTCASQATEILEQDLTNEVWLVISGRTPFTEGKQNELLNNLQDQLEQMQNQSAGEEQRYLSAAIRATRTIEDYLEQLERQMAQGEAVSRNETLYREIHNVAHLASSMINRYMETQIVKMGELNARIKVGMLVAAILLLLFLASIIRAAVRDLFTVDTSIREPIFQLEKMASRIAQGDLSARVPPARIEELYQLTEDLNTMAYQIDCLLHERIEQEQIVKKAELRALQAQITPHFVYNTLETIVWLAEEQRNREVIEMTMAFTDFLRISLSQGQDFITVEKETQHVQNYLKIQSLRYGTIMQYEIAIDHGIAKYKMLKLMLQPLVENAIYHGIKCKRGRGTIRVNGYCKDGQMHFTVKDDGLGMTPEQLDKLRRSLRDPHKHDPNKKGGYGLRNVEQRLQLYYGTGLTIESEYRKGTTVHFCVPCMEGEG